MQLIALAQAVEICGADPLGRTRAAFDFIRQRVPCMTQDMISAYRSSGCSWHSATKVSHPCFKVGEPQPLLGLVARLYG